MSVFNKLFGKNKYVRPTENSVSEPPEFDANNAANTETLNNAADKISNPDNGIFGFAILSDEKFSLGEFAENMLADWGDNIEFKAQRDIRSFTYDGYNFSLLHMKEPISGYDLIPSYELSFDETIYEIDGLNKSYIVVTVFDENGIVDKIGARIAFTKVCIALMEMKNASAMFMSYNDLIIRASAYILQKEVVKASEERGDSYLPIGLWIRFGFVSGERGIAGYTRGFSEMGMRELETPELKKNISTIYDLLFAVSFNVILNNIILDNGKLSIGGGAECIIKIGKSAFSERETAHLLGRA